MKTLLIDVREKEEWDLGNLEGAIHIPLNRISSEILEVTNDKDMRIEVYCRSGHRSGIAKQTLTLLGFTNVENIGGYEELKGQGYK